MNKIIKQITITIIVAFIFCYMTATNSAAQQHCVIDSIKIIPDNPSPQDTLKAICFVSCTESPCTPISVTLLLPINRCEFAIQIDHIADTSFTPCHSIDTITIDTSYFYCTADTISIVDDEDTIPYTVIIVPLKPTSIKENNGANKIVIFPNPTTGDIYFMTTKANMGDESFILTDIYGHLILSDEKSRNGYSRKISLSKLNNGIYFLEIFINGERIIRKIVKE